LRRYRAPCDVDSLRLCGWTAGGNDADRQALGRGDDLPRGACLRAGSGLATALDPSAALPHDTMSRPNGRSRPKSTRAQGRPSATAKTRPTLTPVRRDSSAWGGLLVVISAGLIAYHNSFKGVFILDDRVHIEENARIQQLWPLWDLMAHRPRPLVELSL